VGAVRFDENGRHFKELYTKKLLDQQDFLCSDGQRKKKEEEKTKENQKELVRNDPHGCVSLCLALMQKPHS
jgi:hypothetical protein